MTEVYKAEARERMAAARKTAGRRCPKGKQDDKGAQKREVLEWLRRHTKPVTSAEIEQKEPKVLPRSIVLLLPPAVAAELETRALEANVPPETLGTRLLRSALASTRKREGR